MCKVEKFDEPQKPRDGAFPIYYTINEHGCYNCVSHRRDRDGYCKIERLSKEWFMHRYVYHITFGEIPDGSVIRHKCDNPQCCNPDHLELGTQLENMRDRILRNRPSKRWHRLSVLEQKEIAESELTIPQLALKYDVAHSTIVKAKAKNRMKSERKRAGDKPSIPNKNKAKQKITSHK